MRFHLASLFKSPWLLAGGLSFVLTGVFLGKLFFVAQTHLPSREDGVLISYLITWVATAFKSGQWPYQAPFFFPYLNPLTYSDPFLSTGLLTVPILYFTQNLVLIHNLHLIGSTIIIGIGWYLLGWRLFRSKTAASLMLIWGTFGISHLHYIVHLHTYLVAGIPWSLLGLVSWRQTHHGRWLVLSLIAYWYQLLNSPMTAVFLSVIWACLLIDTGWRSAIKRNQLKLGLLLIMTLVLSGIIYWPYVETSQTFEYTRTIRDTAHFAASLDRLWGSDSIWWLIAVGLLFVKRTRSSPQSRLLTPTILGAILVVGACLMLGPVLKINGQTFKIAGVPIPLPYAAAYYLVPGWQAFRDSSRWIVVFGIGQTLILGYLMAKTKWPTSLQVSLILASVVFLWSSQVPQSPLFPVPLEIPTAYQLLPANQKVVAELPVLYWRMMPMAYLENDRLMYQLHHQHPLYNGVSGFTPPAREQEIDKLWHAFPDESSIQSLQAAGVELVLVHFDLYDQLATQQFMYQDRIASNAATMREKIRQSRLEELSCTSEACLYTIAAK